MPSSLSLCTGALARADRVEYWRHALRQTWDADCRIEPVHATGFDASLTSVECAELLLVRLNGTPHKTSRSGPGRPGRVSIVFQVDGFCTVGDNKHALRMAAGDAWILPPDRDIMIDRATSASHTVIDLPEEDLDERAPDWRRLAGSAILRADRACVTSAADLVRFTLDHCANLNPGCREQLAATLVNLVGGMLNGVKEGAPPTRQVRDSRVTEVHRQRIKRFIRDNLRDPELSVSSVADALGLSPRYVHKVFVTEGMGVMHWMMTQRLRACEREISRRGTRSISDVAYAWGFNSPAHFSRAFKKLFGVSPSEV